MPKDSSCHLLHLITMRAIGRIGRSNPYHLCGHGVANTSSPGILRDGDCGAGALGRIYAGPLKPIPCNHRVRINLYGVGKRPIRGCDRCSHAGNKARGSDQDAWKWGGTTGRQAGGAAGRFMRARLSSRGPHPDALGLLSARCSGVGGVSWWLPRAHTGARPGPWPHDPGGSGAHHARCPAAHHAPSAPRGRRGVHPR